MRRPMSIMRADAQAGWVEILFKIHGVGTEKLAAAQVDDSLSVIGPIGAPFKQQNYRPAPLLIGGGVGIPPMVFLADHLRRMEGKQARRIRPFVVMGSEIPFPFAPRPSRILVDGLPAGVIACLPLLEDWGIASRLASLQGYEGCHDGLVTDLARRWLENMDAAGRETGGDFQLRSRAHAEGRRPAGPRIFPALPGLSGGIHGLRRGRLRGLRRAGV